MHDFYVILGNTIDIVVIGMLIWCIIDLATRHD